MLLRCELWPHGGISMSNQHTLPPPGDVSWFPQPLRRPISFAQLIPFPFQLMLGDTASRGGDASMRFTRTTVLATCSINCQVLSVAQGWKKKLPGQHSQQHWISRVSREEGDTLTVFLFCSILWKYLFIYDNDNNDAHRHTHRHRVELPPSFTICQSLLLWGWCD